MTHTLNNLNFSQQNHSKIPGKIDPLRAPKSALIYKAEHYIIGILATRQAPSRKAAAIEEISKKSIKIRKNEVPTREARTQSQR